MKKQTISKLTASLTTALFCGLVFSSLYQSNAKEVNATPELSLTSPGDSFALLDKSFTANESFVYTADLHFKNGQAGGIAFGAEENDHYFVLNMDRIEDRVKLLYFKTNGVGGYSATELRADYFIGNDKITDSELQMVKPEVAGIENVNLKVILTIEDEHAYAEFFVEGIKRFGIDSVIDLNTISGDFIYQGGYLGMNCFNGDVYLENIEIGKSDYSYFSEPYRNQYHLQPFAKWSNDPNALCYYNGYYHVFYQTHPFGQYWGSMYWGHARSRDLIHFEFLPICLFPETDAMGFGPGNAYMWSGCAITYTKGMSIDVDNENWFPNGNGNGILAIYTRDGGLQDQIVISSDDEGLTWTKRRRIPQTLTGYDYKIDWRDPKVFPLVQDDFGKVSLWGMTLSSYALNKGWFLRSNNLLDWAVVGEFSFPTPECIGVGFLEDQNHVKHAYLTNKSRTYILGNLYYNGYEDRVIFTDEDGHDISTYTLEQMPLKELDFGPDSYASQSFYINDPNSEFNGKDIVLNWFSGDLNAFFCTGPGEYANLRSRWNGGFTIPVEYGVKDTTEGLRLTQKPITVNNPNLEKTELVNVNNKEMTLDSENPLEDVHTHVFELEASINVNNDSPITFKVDVGTDEYMEFGWNKEDGYYVDRTNLDDKGINTNIDWHKKYASHVMGDSDTKTFYVLSDNNGLEVFAEDYSVSFYFVTTASMFSTGASLFVSDGLVNTLKVNEVKTIYRKNIAAGEGVLYVSSHDVTLDTSLCTSKFITCWFSGMSPLEWEELENDGVVECLTTNQGINLTAKKEGVASYKVKAGEQEEIINVNVYSGTFDSNFNFNKANIISGTWVMNEETITGESLSGNAFLLATETGTDFTYTGSFNIESGVAGALVFRAAKDMSSYLVANYDTNEKIVKLWSTHGELARSQVIDIPLTNIIISVKANERNISITVNGHQAINCVLLENEPLSGHFGVNVFSAKVSFKSLTLTRENYEYSSSNLAVTLDVAQSVLEVYNLTKGNVRLEPGFYYQSGDTLFIKEEYFNLLTNGTYRFKVVGSVSTFYISVEVNMTHTFTIEDVTIEKGVNVNVYVGNNEINSVKVNGENLNPEDFLVENYTLSINSICFKEGENTVVLNDTITFVVTVKVLDEEVIDKDTSNNTNLPLILGLSIGGGCLLIGGGIALFFVLRHLKGKKA